jgi:hypothetical protein
MKTLHTLCAALLVSTLAGCGGGGGAGLACGGLLSAACNTAKPNTEPVANAGTIQNVTLDVPAFVNGVPKLIKLVTLDGSRSTDKESDSLNLTYKWTMTEKPGGSNATLSSASSVRPTFIADVTGVYRISLVVSDGKLSSVNDASVTVVASITNSAPVADAGPTQNVVLGSTVMLDGTTSTDADLSDPRIYRWALQVPKSSGSTARLSDASSPRPTFVADKLGEYIATLWVSDGKVESSPVMVSVFSSVENTAPTARAGDDQTVKLGTSAVTVSLDGTNSTDPENDRLSYKWTWMSYPTSVSVTTAPSLTATSPRPTFTPTIAGTYVLALTVNDGKKDSTPDPVTITVNAASTNTPPVAVAGTDQYVPVSSTNKITLNGSASYDSDAGETSTLSYKWYLSRPAADTTTTTSPFSSLTSPTFYASTAGVYVASLVVTDANGKDSAVSTTRVTASTANSPPVANAGVSLTGTVGTEVTLDGSASTDADGDTITYAWTIQSAPDNNSVTSLTNASTATPSFTPNAVGVYVIKLIVNDGKVSSAAHTVTVTVAASS